VSIRDTEFPQFVTAFRGYDRLQVDDYINRLREYAGQFEERALVAEPELAEVKHELVRLREQFDDVDRELAETRRRLREAPNTELPPRLGQILTLASDEAESMRDQARHYAQEILHRARAAADETMQRSRRESELLVAEANRRRTVMETQIWELDAARRVLIDHLTAVADDVLQMVSSHNESVPELPRPAAGRHHTQEVLSLPAGD
jgi:cell division septum initiation protein DivIVA